MNRAIRVLVSGAMMLLAAVLTVWVASHAVVHYELPPPTGSSVPSTHTDVLGSVIVATVVCGVACLLLVVWAVVCLVLAPRPVLWLLPAAVLAACLVSFLLGITAPTPLY